MATLFNRPRPWALLLFCLPLLSSVNAQSDCANTVALAQGYSTSISGVADNGNGSYTIVLTVLNDGCAGCKKLNAFTVEADPGTYSNVSVQVLFGPFTYANIDLGPNLSGTSLTGFRINNTNGMGNGNAAGFTVTYTLTGGFQDQQTVAKAGSNILNTYFSAADFQSVLDCQNGLIFPYFNPYANKSYDIIGVELTSLYYTYLDSGSYISDDIFQILGSSVRVSIRTQPGEHANAVSLLTTPAYGLVQELNDPGNNLIEGTFPILQLLSLNLLPDLLVSVRPIYAALTNVGLITSQGDTAMRAFRAREVFGVDGTGIKVGVLSDSYNTKLGDPAADDVLRGDLPGSSNAAHPAPVDVLLDYPFGTRSDEGRAMLQIVHDIAPGASLAFRTGFLGAVDFANGIRDLEQAGCDVIVDDITYISEPMFRDGVVAQAVDQVKAMGVSYFSAAGNFGTNSWQGTFAPAAAPAGVVGVAHDFGSGYGATDILQSITLYQGSYTVVLQWDDGTPGTTTNSDFDIYLANNNGNTLFGFNRMNIGGEPLEVLPFVVGADSVQSNIVIVRESGSGPALLKYIVYRGHLEINEYDGLTASTLAGQANAAGAISVGAVLYENTPEYLGVTPTVASFSSRGGTPVNGVVRLKPEICAPNGVNTSVDLGGVNYDGDAFPNFFGTSAAAPHAAGVAALVLEARTKYYGDTLSPDLLKGVLQGTALDMNTPGHDLSTGAGFILADSALMDLANPRPYIYAIHYDTSLTPGVDTLLLTVYGEYLNDASTIWLDGVPLTNGVVIQGDTAIITLVDPFAALYPAIQVHNPPKAGTNGTDGGLSDPLYFTTKETVLIRIDNASKKYGQALPEFTAEYTLESVGNSVPLAAAGLAPYELDRILDIDLTTIATSLSNVGLWGISGDPNDPLVPNSSVPASDTLDLSLLDRFNFVIVNGLLTIDPLALTIIPRDTTFVYNDSIVGLTFDYVINGDPLDTVPLTASDSLAIVNATRNAHGTALVNRTGIVKGTALVNSDGDQLLNDTLLSNFSFMISQRVTSTRGTALVNGELIDPQELYDAAAFTSAVARSVRGTALVNGYPLVRGTALVNTVDSLGNITNTSPLTNSGSLVNNSGTVNATTITLESNAQTLVILGDTDIAILAGDTTGDVTIRSVNLVTGRTVGTHISIPGTFLSNNFIVQYGLGNITILPDTVEFIFGASTLEQTYDGTPKTVSVSTLPDSLDLIVTYNGDTVPPVNAGTYLVEVSLLDSNYVVLGSSTDTLVILPATALIAIDPGTTTAVYDGGPKFVGVSIDPGSIAYSVTYNGSTTAPVNAGTYAVHITVVDGNYTGSLDTTLVIAKVSATAATGIYYISKGNPLPVFSATYDGFVNGENASVVTAVSFTLSPNYNGNAGVYTIHVSASAANYVFTSINGTLYVNPSGPGTKQVKPSFICYDQLDSADASGFLFVAYFEYENRNSTPVYIPIGPSNSISGTAHDPSEQPALFLTSGGMIAVPFDGGPLTWQVTSNKNNGTTGSIPANSSNNACGNGNGNGRSLIVRSVEDKLRVYPNPSAGKVFLEFADDATAGAVVEIHDARGVKCPVEVRSNDERLMEVDLSSLGHGMYVINVIQRDGISSHRVVIQ